MPATALNSLRSSGLSASVGLDVLAGFLGGGAGAALGIDNTDKVAFDFPEVFLDSVSQAAIGTYLGDCRLPADHALWGPYARGEGELFIIYETVKCRRFNVLLEGKAGAPVSVNLPALKEIVGARAKLQYSSERTEKLTYDGEAPLVFGFKCARLLVKDGRLELRQVDPAGGLALRSLDGAPSGDVLRTERGEGLLDLLIPEGRA